MKKKTKIVIAVVGFLVVTGIFLSLPLLPPKGKGENTSPIKRIGEYLRTESCTDDNTTFTHPPIDLDNIISITPLGNLNPSGHTFPTRHMYYQVLKEDPNDDFSRSVTAPLYAPISATIESVSVMTLLSDDPPTVDYSLSFRTCEDFSFYFIHITSLSTDLTDQFEFNDDDCSFSSPGGSDYKQCWMESDIKVEGGDVLGTVGSGYRSSFDFGVTDFRIEAHDVANADRWKNFDAHRYMVCSTDYYAGDLQDSLEAKLGMWNGSPRTVEPRCGTVEQDVYGTAQGVWFEEGLSAMDGEETGMALVHDNGDPTKGVFSIGSSHEDIGIPSNTYFFDPRTSGRINTDFDLITPGDNVYCYESSGFFEYEDPFSIVIQLLDDDTLRIGRHTDLGCNSIPDSIEGGKVFVR